MSKIVQQADGTPGCQVTVRRAREYLMYFSCLEAMWQEEKDMSLPFKCEENRNQFPTAGIAVLSGFSELLGQPHAQKPLCILMRWLSVEQGLVNTPARTSS